METVWISKHALSTGIYQTKVRIVGKNAIENIMGGEKKIGPKDWHRTRQSAMNRALELLNSRTASLEKEMARINALRHELVKDFLDC